LRKLSTSARATISRVKRALQGNAEYNTLAELVKRARKMADSPAPATLPAAPKAPSKQATDQKEDTQGLLQKLDQTQMHLNNLAAIVDSYADKIIELDDLLNETVKKMTLLKGSF
jgi:septation ring formation regulator EzrA